MISSCFRESSMACEVCLKHVHVLFHVLKHHKASSMLGAVSYGFKWDIL